jgi:hypothetical protein
MRPSPGVAVTEGYTPRQETAHAVVWKIVPSPGRHLSEMAGVQPPVTSPRATTRRPGGRAARGTREHVSRAAPGPSRGPVSLSMRCRTSALWAGSRIQIRYKSAPIRPVTGWLWTARNRTSARSQACLPWSNAVHQQPQSDALAGRAGLGVPVGQVMVEVGGGGPEGAPSPRPPGGLPHADLGAQLHEVRPACVEGCPRALDQHY